MEHHIPPLFRISRSRQKMRTLYSEQGMMDNSLVYAKSWMNPSGPGIHGSARMLIE